LHQIRGPRDFATAGTMNRDLHFVILPLLLLLCALDDGQ
jgi:hypothetical protein